MNTLELEEVLKKINCTKNKFGAVYPSDLLPLEVKQYPQFFAANFDTSEKSGFHWVAFILLMISMESSLTRMGYLLIDTQNILKISSTKMQLSVLTIGSTSKACLPVCKR